MPFFEELRRRLGVALERRRMSLSAAEAVLLLSGLGLVCGVLSGVVILLFRALVEATQGLLLPGAGENYVALEHLWRLLLPLLGGLLVGLYLRYVADEHSRDLGVTHVMARLAYHQGHLPWRNAVHQFIGAAISISAGHSVGREGPSVHLGAAVGSQLGHRLRLPNNSMRTLVACGSAAAIAASFNTPLAGVIFAMEVVMMEYTIAGFLPVILSAVVATALMQLVYGAEPAFAIPSLHLAGLGELPYMALLGLLMGVLAASFIHLLQYCSGLFKGRSLVLRTSLGGLGVGLCALLVPQVMGIGYGTVELALLGEIGLLSLLAIAVMKLIASAFGLGMGLPGGLIGPTVVIGAAAGGAVGYLAGALTPGLASSPALYALIGMGAMMGATLRAPLAALTAMLELTANPNVILPGMLAIVIASLICSELFGKDSVFLMRLRAVGVEARAGLLSGLSRMGVARVMDRRVVAVERIIGRATLRQLLQQDPRWLLLREEAGAEPRYLLPVADVLHYLESDAQAEEIDLLAIPGGRLQAEPIDSRATLAEAVRALHGEGSEALYVTRVGVPGATRYYGVVLRKEIERQYF